MESGSWATVGIILFCSAWICRQTASADSPIPLSVTRALGHGGQHVVPIVECLQALLARELSLHRQRHQQLFPHQS